MPNYNNQLEMLLTDLDKIKHEKNDKHNSFIQPINYKYETAAMRNLNGNAFKLWRYFLHWYGTDRFFFSPAAIRKELGLGENGATSARQELERKGYITPVIEKKNCYRFSPVLPVDYENLKNKGDIG